MSDKTSNGSALWVASAPDDGSYDVNEFFDENFNITAQIYAYEFSAHDGMALFSTAFGKYNSDTSYYIVRDKNYVPIITVTLNGVPIQFDQSPIIENGRTLVPLRAIFEAMGATVDWNGSTQIITVTMKSTTITMRIGNNIMTKNGQNLTLDVPPEIVNDRTLVPVRAIAESFGAIVNWDGDTKTVIISN